MVLLRGARIRVSIDNTLNSILQNMIMYLSKQHSNYLYTSVSYLAFLHSRNFQSFHENASYYFRTGRVIAAATRLVTRRNGLCPFNMSKMHLRIQNKSYDLMTIKWVVKYYRFRNDVGQTCNKQGSEMTT